MRRYAEDANYWQTTVHPAKSQAEILEILEAFGVVNVILTQGMAGGRLAWLVRFQWGERAYRFVFTPLECRQPAKVSSFGGKRRSAEEQSRYQMGRIAAAFVKAVMTAAETDPYALFGFMELPGAVGTSGIPATAGELDVGGLAHALSLDIPGRLLLESRQNESEEDTH